MVEDASLTDDQALIGENCHIVGSSQDGPRGGHDLEESRRDLYPNLILLCRNHHRVIDQMLNEFPVERLREIKSEHEQWVRAQLQPDEERQRQEEAYAAIVDGWVQRARIDNWAGWTSFVVGSGQPRLAKSVEEDLQDLAKWLLTRHWSGLLLDLEQAFLTFRFILQDFLSVFHRHSDTLGDSYITEKFYKLIWHKDPEDYHRLAAEYDAHVDLVTDLCFELTRAANRVIAVVRRTLIRSFREDEGKLTISRGPNQNFGWDTYVPEYRGELANVAQPYEGVDNLLANLKSRDFWFSTPAE